jgi:hypothetical protein
MHHSLTVARAATRFWQRHVAVAAILACMVPGNRLHAQVVEYKAGQMTAYPNVEANSEFLKKVRWGVNPASMLSLYVGVFRGAPGVLDSLSIDTLAQSFPVRFPTLDFVVSAAARIQSELGESAVSTHLRRLNAHVRLTPLDSLKRPIQNESALEVLGIQPNNIQSAPQDSTLAKGKAGMVSILTRAYLPGVLGALGARATSVAANFHNSGLALSAPTQVSYLSASTEFGWTWYEHPHGSIEGIHRTAALLQVSPEVRFVRVQIALITDWKYHGNWQKPFDAVVDVGRASVQRP